jgi:hypothetical protein
MTNPPDLVLFDKSMSERSMDVVKNELKRMSLPLLDTHDTPWHTRMLVDAAMVD